MRRHSLTYFILALVFALASLVAYVLWFLAFSSAHTEAVAAATEVIRIEREDAAIANAEDTIAALSADEAMLNGYFVSSDGIVPFLEELERSGEGQGSLVEVVSVTPPGTSGGRLALAVRIEGSFESVMRTLGSMEYGPRDMRIVSVTLDTPPVEEATMWIAAATFSVATLAETP